MPDPLADLADLQLRDLATDPDKEDLANELLAVASSIIREAAGVPISRETVTITIPGSPGKWLDVPGKPIVSVTDVSIDDTSVSDWKLIGGRLWRACGWLLRAALDNPRSYAPGWDEPTNVTMTVTGGLSTVPSDIVDLACAMVGAALNKAEEGYEVRGDETAERIDDYSVQYPSDAAARLAGVMELPAATRDRLAARFGSNVAVLVSSQ